MRRMLGLNVGVRVSRCAWDTLCSLLCVYMYSALYARVHVMLHMQYALRVRECE